MNNNRPTARIAGAIVIALASGTVRAADLQNFVIDLYGGDGVSLSSQGGPFAAAHAAHFTDESLEAFTLLNSAIASSSGTFAFNSTFTGLTFDVATGVPVERRTASDRCSRRAPRHSARARSIWLSASHASNTTASTARNSTTSCRLSARGLLFVPGRHPATPPDGVISGFETDLVRVTLDIDLEYDVFAFFANYGLTDRWDVGIVVPVISVDARASAHAEVVPVSGTAGIHSFFGQDELQNSATGGSETGIGDVVVRTKYNFLRDQGAAPDLSLLAQVTAATGDEKKLLQGTGETRYKAGLIASKRVRCIRAAFECCLRDLDWRGLSGQPDVCGRFP